MARKSYKPEEIVAKLQQVDFWPRRARAWPRRSARRGQRGDYYRWRQEYGGLLDLKQLYAGLPLAV